MCRMHISFFSADLKKKMPKKKKTKQQNDPDFGALKRRVLEMF